MVVGDVGYERSPAGVAKMGKAAALLLAENTRALRFLGSAVLSVVWVACGRASAVYYGLHEKDQPKPWDFCAAYAIARPAGVCFLQTAADAQSPRKPFDIYDGQMVCAATDELTETLCGVVLKARASCSENVVGV